MRKSITVALAVLSQTGLSAAQDNCQIPFAFDSSKVDSKALEVCLETLSVSQQKELSIAAFASEEGTKSYNQNLSDRRAKAVAKAIKAKNKDVKIEAKGFGEKKPEGRVAILSAPSLAVAKEEVPGTKVASVGTSDASMTKAAPASLSDGRWRAAFRSGFDTTRVESRKEYFAPGIDVAYLPELANPSLRLEIGALASLYAENNNNRLGSYHFAPMVGYQKSGYIAGLRGLAGVVHSNETDKDFTDTGAELRLGVEKEQWSLFLGAGRTSTLDRVAMDFGYRF